jgi:lantibiotic modifying enzyme
MKFITIFMSDIANRKDLPNYSNADRHATKANITPLQSLSTFNNRALYHQFMSEEYGQKLLADGLLSKEDFLKLSVGIASWLVTPEAYHALKNNKISMNEIKTLTNKDIDYFLKKCNIQRNPIIHDDRKTAPSP